MAKAYTPKTFKKGAVLVKPQGFLDGNNVNLVITPADMTLFLQKKIIEKNLLFWILVLDLERI